MAALLLRRAAMRHSTHLVTLSTHRRRFVLSGDGADIAADALRQLLRRCPGLDIDAAVVTPDRMYAIVRLPNAAVLRSLVLAYKAETTRTIRTKLPVDRVWERGFEHREIRDEAELIAVRALLKTYEQRQARAT